ncbi:MAG: transglycosylase domain-containing protein [Chitinophagales bacterium]
MVEPEQKNTSNNTGIAGKIRLLNEAYPFPVKVFRVGFRTAGVFVAALFVLYLLILVGAFGLVPGKHALKEVKNYTASEIISSDSVLLGKYFIENRTNAKYADFPPHLVQELVATEDARFYDHKGVDFVSFVRVLVLSIVLNDDAGGGSTITQQLAKNLYGRKDYGPLSMPVNKFREMIIAGRLEDVYTKEEILTLYFNTVPFGEDCYGIESAALRFFNKKPQELTIEESAVLVGLLKANTTYNPRSNPEKSFNRRNIVLGLWAKHNAIDTAYADSLKRIPLTIDYHPENQNIGSATYFREYLRKELEKWCKENPREDGSQWNIYTDGLIIHTTLHAGLQKYAEESMAEQMQALQKQFLRDWGKSDPWKNSKTDVVKAAVKRSDRYKEMEENGYSDKGIMKTFAEPVESRLFTWNGIEDTIISPLDSVKHQLKLLQTGFLAMDPRNGNILAWIGGIDFSFFKYDHVLSRRQVGSTFKPVVYATALETGMEPCTYIPNKLTTYSDFDNWTPANSDGEYGGFYSLKGGLTYSVNTVAAHLIMQTGVDAVIAQARKMGIEGELPKVPSIALGTASLSLQEMVTAYACFANRGMRVEPNDITLITTAEGDTIYAAKPAKKTRALSETTADEMIQMMRSVINSGTGSRLRGTYGISLDLAGKTGTTQNNTDGWFIAYNSRLVMGCWVGAEDPAIRWPTTAHGQGAATALPVIGKFLGKSVKDKDTRKYVSGGFTPLPDSVMIQMDCALWMPDSIPVDSMSFIPRMVGKIKEFLNKNGNDSLIQQKYPGAEDD